MTFGDFFLHACIRRYLCQRSFTYHLTGLSKAASPVGDVGKAGKVVVIVSDATAVRGGRWARAGSPALHGQFRGR